MCALRRKAVFNNFKVDEHLRYKRILMPLAMTRRLKDCLRHWRVSLVRDRCNKRLYFCVWRKKAASVMVYIPVSLVCSVCNCTRGRFSGVCSNSIYLKALKDGCVDLGGHMVCYYLEYPFEFVVTCNFRNSDSSGC